MYSKSLLPYDEKRKIYILLTRYYDNGAKAISAFTNSFYTHASIGLEEDMNTFYSFGYKGFRIETITKYVCSDREPYPCQLYEISVTPKKYERIKQLLLDFEANRASFKYARFGVVLALLRVPFRYRRHYFCSQFVAEVLKKSEAAELPKCPSLFMPCDFHKLKNASVRFVGDVSGLSRRFVCSC